MHWELRVSRRGFTLIELLVVVAIIALLIAILIPALGAARQKGIATRCLANMQGIGRGLIIYQEANDGYVVPSYNMPVWGTYKVQQGAVVDGWAVILDRDGVVPASKGLVSNIFYCPNTLDIVGMAGGQTLYDQDKPQGYQDWPILFLDGNGGDGGVKGAPPALPIAGFGDSSGLYTHQIRCGYFLNAQNPISSTPPSGSTAPVCPYYTQTSGYGPYADGTVLGPVKAQNFPRPQSLIVACDGMYMGRQSVTRIGEQNRRIGYRHPSSSVTVTVNGTTMTFDKTVSNAVFADGHAEPIPNKDFPHSNVPGENTGSFSLLANP
jgi:prepilin-type N-terminal cleavage/methylation domain-containing protein/prepilin-type processing-associated H-X9-DG protein